MTTQFLPAVGHQLWFLEGLIEQRDHLQHVPINSVPFRIGRSSELGLYLPYPAVSKSHAEIIAAGDKLFLSDLDSTNGTFVNGHRIEGTVPVGDGDLIQFATVDFRVKRQASQNFGNTVEDASSDFQGVLLRFQNLMTSKAVVPLFQPIVSFADGQLAGYEILSRSRLEGLETPYEMFLIAERMGLAAELSSLLRCEGIRIGDSLSKTVSLFVNTHPHESLNAGLLNNLRDLREKFPNRPLTIEIHEAAVTNPTKMREFRATIKDLNISLAYDDFGAGQARLTDLVEVPPDYLKFDIKLIRDIHLNTPQLHMVESLVGMVRDFGIAAIAEGIECDEEAKICKEIGFDYAQGYHFGRPASVEAIEPG